MAALVAGAAVAVAPARPSSAQSAEVSGEAYGHYTKVGLFGGPQGVVGPAPRVVLPPNGSDVVLTASEADGASVVFGPATILGGRQPIGLGTAPVSGPIHVTTKGQPGLGGSVTSTASITLHPTPVPVTCDGDPPGTKNCNAPGGFGPVIPNEGDELHATCTANEEGVTGSARFVNAVLTTSTDEGGEPKDREPIPEFPPPNYTRTGEITNVGDKWKIVYNEQFVDPDGAITVNALHMYLLGDVAVGEQILGHVRCSMNPASASPTTSIPSPSTSLTGSTTPRTLPPDPVATTKSDPVPFLVLGAALVAGVALLVLWGRRRRLDDARDAPKDSS